MRRILALIAMAALVLALTYGCKEESGSTDEPTADSMAASSSVSEPDSLGHDTIDKSEDSLEDSV